MLSTSLRIQHRVRSLVITGAVVASVLAGPVSLARAQTRNQRYTCGAYGASDYGRNDCVATDTAAPSVTPTLVASMTPRPSSHPASTPGGLPVTGVQLVWVSLIGLGLVMLGSGLSLRVRRRRSPPPQS